MPNARTPSFAHGDASEGPDYLGELLRLREAAARLEAHSQEVLSAASAELGKLETRNRELQAQAAAAEKQYLDLAESSRNLQAEVATRTEELERTNAALEDTLVERRTELDRVKHMYTTETEELARVRARTDFAKEHMTKASAQMDQLVAEIEEFTTSKSRGKTFAKKTLGACKRYIKKLWRLIH